MYHRNPYSGRKRQHLKRQKGVTLFVEVFKVDSVLSCRKPSAEKCEFKSRARLT